MPRDPEKARARAKRYRERQKIKKYGPGAAGKDMRGRHGNHAKGPANARWNESKLITSHGYVAVKVPISHPHGWGPPGLKGYRYAYEHVVVAMGYLGRALLDNEIVHHVNGNRQDNRWANLAVQTRSEHAKGHASADGARDDLGRFAPDHPRTCGGDPSEWPEDLRVREYPEARMGGLRE